MTKTFSATEFRNNLGEVLNLVHYKNVNVIIERMGKPVAKLTKFSDPGDKKVNKRKKTLKFAGMLSKDEAKKLEGHTRLLRKTAALNYQN